MLKSCMKICVFIFRAHLTFSSSLSKTFPCSIIWSEFRLVSIYCWIGGGRAGIMCKHKARLFIYFCIFQVLFVDIANLVKELCLQSYVTHWWIATRKTSIDSIQIGSWLWSGWIIWCIFPLVLHSACND